MKHVTVTIKHEDVNVLQCAVINLHSTSLSLSRSFSWVWRSCSSTWESLLTVSCGSASSDTRRPCRMKSSLSFLPSRKQDNYFTLNLYWSREANHASQVWVSCLWGAGFPLLTSGCSLPAGKCCTVAPSSLVLMTPLPPSAQPLRPGTAAQDTYVTNIFIKTSDHPTRSQAVLYLHLAVQLLQLFVTEELVLPESSRAQLQLLIKHLPSQCLCLCFG